MDREHMQEVINGMRKIVKPYLAKQLKKINFEGCGNTDKAEFETDFEIVLTLAEKALAIPSAEPCEDAISRQDVLDLIEDMTDQFGIRHRVITEGVIKLLPSVKQDPKVGQWIEQIDYEENCRTLICSNCDRPALHDENSIWKHKFCPHCGAKMVETQESEE